MKGLIVLLCALVAVQARSTAVSKSPVREAAVLGENPWILHLRIAVGTSGLLNTCAGSLISSSWALTAASCLEGSRFIWIRYGAVVVITPELVTEASLTRINDGFNGGVQNNVGLVNINRVVEFTSNISPVALTSDTSSLADISSLAGIFCTYNEVGSAVSGEVLTCSTLEVEAGEDSLTTPIQTTEFDLGAPLVKDGVQIGVLAGSADGSTTFLRPSDYLEWIEEQTGLDFSSGVDAVVAAEDGTKVIFVN